MPTSNSELIKILLVLGPFVGMNPDLLAKKLNEISVKMDDHWKLFAITSHPISQVSSSCTLEFHIVRLLGSPKSLASRVFYLLGCIRRGVGLVKKEDIQVITQHDGHLEYGIVAYVISKLTHRKCLIRINEDTLIPFIFFLKDSQNFLFRSKTILWIIAFGYRSLERSFLKRVDWIITHGPMDYQEIKKINNRITFVPLWVDTKKFRRLDEEYVQRSKKELAISKDMRILLFVGRLHPEKGVVTLLRALKTLKDKRLTLLLVYSFSEYKREYQNLAEQLGISDQVRFIGYIPNDDMPKYYNLADLYILPSLREEWSNTIMEAMACRTPVIASDTGSNPYLVMEKKTGFLVHPNDSNGLAQQIRFVLDHPDASKCVTEAAACEITQYDKNTIGDAYKTVVISLAKSQKEAKSMMTQV
ncbi:glycosyltransferase family 4 protein [Candidatus Bathyarchaeota archaeon]|nr:glycosyltransferase family 4 protein [Candidatus Bathyarchaeota archaeon]